MESATSLMVGLEELETVSKGATCNVKLYRRKGESKVYAVKVIDMKRASTDGNMARQVQREKLALEAVSAGSEYIVDFFGACKDSLNLYFLLEYVDGGDLYKHIQAGPGRRLPKKHAQVYGLQISKAICYLHENNWVYRDLKANNIAISSTGNCKLFDFGTAKQLPDLPFRTKTQLGVGHHYAPEVVCGEEHGLPADWWSFGVLIVEMLTGEPPFPYLLKNGEKETLKSLICTGLDYEELKKNPFVRGEALELVEKLTRQNPSERIEASDVLEQGWFSNDANLESTHVTALIQNKTETTGLKNDPFADW
eukprot:CAMPEP_0203752490 /NCGR_PEP_ID=MMETSP0098-20131031/6414_1 /ASSEMBLY_ACC=CAM_ASM_000208 /TAXON_ID=96639 /ORGANISM=" , Strain NY0313808BC1" /LENGTH=308 /DNA_ID=CAMNT_0050642691 /DNA_START=457 /DNA_END=1383 /DNA_ORIENTATION=+